MHPRMHSLGQIHMDVELQVRDIFRINREGNPTHANFPYSTSTYTLSSTTLQYGEKSTLASFPFSTTTRALLTSTLHKVFSSSKITSPSNTLCHEGNIVIVSYPFSANKIITSTILPTLTLHYEGKLAPTIFSSSTNIRGLETTTLHYQEKVVQASFHSSTSTNALQTITLCHEGKLNRLAFLIAQAQLPYKKQHFTMNEI